MLTAFQSSPNPKVGCHPCSLRPLPVSLEFQSSPNPKVGCHMLFMSRPEEGWVPCDQFQSSPNPKVGCHFARARETGLLDIQVSILTQPEGWVPWEDKSDRHSFKTFQSSPNPKVGCHWSTVPFRRSSVFHSRRFNPHPTRRLGAISDMTSPCSSGGPPGLRFNPHPTRRLGAICLRATAGRAMPELFQSSPNPKVGCHCYMPR